MTADARTRRGMYSAVSAMVLDMAPPMPSPVSSRNTTSDSTDQAFAVSSEPRPKISGHTMSTGRRPRRSASGPNTSAPIIIPTSPLDSTGPSAARSTWNSARSAGAT
jgi:hypothetical protein